MENASAKILVSGGTLGLASDVGRGDFHKDNLDPYSDDDDGGDWYFAHVPVDCNADVCASRPLDFDDTPNLCFSASVVISNEANGSSARICRI